MKNAWQTLSSQSLLRDRGIDLRSDRCITPAGQEISPYYVLRYPDWVHVVALTKERELVLVQQYRHAAGQTFLELPAGGVETGDADPLSAARRELREETGFASEQWISLPPLYANPATHTNRVHAFVALDAALKYPPALERGEEGLEVHILSIDAVFKDMETGQFGQSMHAASLLLALHTLNAAGRCG